jgi:hypothetical protein
MRLISWIHPRGSETIMLPTVDDPIPTVHSVHIHIVDVPWFSEAHSIHSLVFFSGVICRLCCFSNMIEGFSYIETN